MFSKATPPVVRPKVTPDPQAAAELARKLAQLEYVPESGFHRDRRQPRKVQGWA